MTPAQLRAIASYVGAPYSVEVYDRNVNKPDWPYEWQYYQGKGTAMFTHLLLASIGHNEPDVARNFKLHLRRIESLADEEVLAMVDAANVPGFDTYRQKDKVITRGRFFDIEVGAYGGISIDFDTCTVNTGMDSCQDGSPLSVHNPGAVIAYLQSIGVYIPGMVEEQFVEFA